MGYAEASREQAEQIDIPFTRMRAEIECLLVSADAESLAGHGRSAAKRLEEAEDLLHRAIEYGAMIDPWNVLGFQGNFNRFQAVEDAVTDHRVDVLLLTMQKMFDAYASLYVSLLRRVTRTRRHSSKNDSSRWSIGGINSRRSRSVVSGASRDAIRFSRRDSSLRLFRSGGRVDNRPVMFPSGENGQNTFLRPSRLDSSSMRFLGKTRLRLGHGPVDAMAIGLRAVSTGRGGALLS